MLGKILQNMYIIGSLSAAIAGPGGEPPEAKSIPNADSVEFEHIQGRDSIEFKRIHRAFTTARDMDYNIIFVETKKSYFNITKLVYYANDDSITCENSDACMIADALREANNKLKLDTIVSNLAGYDVDLYEDSEEKRRVALPISASQLFEEPLLEEPDTLIIDYKEDSLKPGNGSIR